MASMAFSFAKINSLVKSAANKLEESLDRAIGIQTAPDGSAVPSYESNDASNTKKGKRTGGSKKREKTIRASPVPLNDDEPRDIESSPEPTQLEESGPSDQVSSSPPHEESKSPVNHVSNSDDWASPADQPSDPAPSSPLPTQQSAASLGWADALTAFSSPLSSSVSNLFAAATSTPRRDAASTSFIADSLDPVAAVGHSFSSDFNDSVDSTAPVADSSIDADTSDYNNSQFVADGSLDQSIDTDNTDHQSTAEDTDTAAAAEEVPAVPSENTDDGMTPQQSEQVPQEQLESVDPRPPEPASPPPVVHSLDSSFIAAADPPIDPPINHDTPSDALPPLPTAAAARKPPRRKAKADQAAQPSSDEAETTHNAQSATCEEPQPEPAGLERTLSHSSALSEEPIVNTIDDSQSDQPNGSQPLPSPSESGAPSESAGGVGIEDYEAKIAALQKKLKQVHATAKQAVQMARDARNETSEYQRQISVRETQLEKCQTEILSLRQTVDKHIQRQKEMETRAGALEDEQASWRSQIVAKEEKITMLTKKCDAAAKSQQEAERQLERVRKELAAKDEQLQKERDEARAKEIHLNELQARVKRGKNDHEEKSSRLTELSTANKQLESQVVQLKVELKAAEDTIAELKTSYEGRATALNGQLQQVQSLLTKSNKEAADREEALKRELASQRLKCQQAYERNEELTSAVPAATRPLLKQIESLQAAVKGKAALWEATERTLKSRIQDLEAQLVEGARSRQLSQERLGSLELDLADTRGQLEVLRSEHRTASLALQTSKERVNELEEQIHRLKDQLSMQQASAEEAFDEAKTAHKRLKHFSEEKSEQIRELEHQLAAEKLLRQKAESQLNSWMQSRLLGEDASSSSSSAAGSGPSGSAMKAPVPIASSPLMRSQSVSSHGHTRNVSGSSEDMMRSEASFYAHSLAAGAASDMSTVETIKALLRMREGEVSSLKKQVDQLTQSRNALSDELVTVTSEYNKALQNARLIPELQAQIQTITLRYEAALEVIAEKDEEMSDLQNDLAHVKEVFRVQVKDLLERLKAVEGGAAHAATIAAAASLLSPSALTAPRPLASPSPTQPAPQSNAKS